MDSHSSASKAAVKLPRVAVGLVVWRGEEVLLIRRGREPHAGMWSIPGGKVQFGERLEETGLRELAEETGVSAQIAGLIDVFEAIEDDSHYVMVDFAARWTSGEPMAGDDAAEAAFFPFDEALALLSWDMTRDALRRSRVVLTGQNAAAKSG
jgi:8-oxo-dGTP diphosphatase